MWQMIHFVQMMAMAVGGVRRGRKDCLTWYQLGKQEELVLGNVQGDGGKAGACILFLLLCTRYWQS